MESPQPTADIDWTSQWVPIHSLICLLLVTIAAVSIDLSHSVAPSDNMSSSSETGIVDWADNEDRSSCSIDFAIQFGKLVTRRHHCRACGCLVSDKSSRTKMILQGFALPDQPQRICNRCATATPQEIDALRTMWQLLSRSAGDAPQLKSLASAVTAIAAGRFPIVVVGASNWRRAVSSLQSMIVLEISVCKVKLSDLTPTMSVKEIDEYAMLRGERLAEVINMTSGFMSPIPTVPLFMSTMHEARMVRRTAVVREGIRNHQKALMSIGRKLPALISLKELVTAWGAYQKFGEEFHACVPRTLESRMRALLNEVVTRELNILADIMRTAIASRDLDKVRRAAAEVDRVTDVLYDAKFRDHVMPDVHVSIPGFSELRLTIRDVTKGIMPVSTATSGPASTTMASRRSYTHPPRKSVRAAA